MHKLVYYQKKFGNLPTQGSSEWLEGRSLTFGGSELATVLGQNKYEKIDKLIHRKVNQIHEAKDQTNWGKLFEPVAKIYLKEDIGDIYEFGSIPHSYYPISYSPDGLFVKDDELHLLEIKCPIYNGVEKIKECYQLQVQTGMSVINVKDCLFTQFKFRRCLFGQKVDNCTYDKTYHKGWRQPWKFPISWGYLWWNTADDKIIDVGNYEEMLPSIEHLPAPEIFIEQEFTKTNGKVLQWKLFDKKYETIKPEPNFLQKHEAELWKRYKQLQNI